MWFENQHSEQPSELNVLPRGTVVVPGTQSPRRMIPYKLPDTGKIQYCSRRMETERWREGHDYLHMGEYDQASVGK